MIFKSGVAGAGGISFDPRGNKVADFSWGLGISTNNQAEWLALYHSLEIAVTLNMEHLQVFEDSRHVIQAMRNGNSHKSAKSQRIQKRIKSLKLPIDTPFFHVLRDLNPIANKMANVGVTMKKGQASINNVLNIVLYPNDPFAYGFSNLEKLFKMWPSPPFENLLSACLGLEATLPPTRPPHGFKLINILKVHKLYIIRRWNYQV